MKVHVFSNIFRLMLKEQPKTTFKKTQKCHIRRWQHHTVRIRFTFHYDKKRKPTASHAYSWLIKSPWILSLPCVYFQWLICVMVRLSHIYSRIRITHLFIFPQKLYLYLLSSVSPYIVGGGVSTSVWFLWFSLVPPVLVRKETFANQRFAC